MFNGYAQLKHDYLKHCKVKILQKKIKQGHNYIHKNQQNFFLLLVYKIIFFNLKFKKIYQF